MRFLSLATAALLPFAALAAGGDRFEEAHAKAQPVKLDDKTYQHLTKAPRDYSVAVLLTALDARFGCHLCNVFQPEWELLAKSWTRGDSSKESRLVFGTLDFLDGKETFKSMMLQTAPVLVFFHPTTGPHARPGNVMERLDFTGGIETAEPVHRWIARRLPDRPHPPFVRPIDYFKIAVTTTAVLGGITFVTVALPYVLPIIQNRNLWAAITLIAVLLFISGHMFNHIRQVPYVGGGKGAVHYFSPGFQSQYGLESQVVAAIYGVLAFATISLALKTPRMTNPRAQQAAVFVWGGIILGTYSFLMSIFRLKNGGYPFWLPPF